jgi:small-conductance mechanosensitive channel
MEKVVEKEELAQFDRAHFSAINDFSLEYTVVYFVKSAEYLDYMNVNEKILLNIKKSFEKEKIKFAYPTQTVYLSKENN